MDARTAEEAKSYGNNAFRNGDWPSAIALYSHALQLADGDTSITHILYSNRSAAYLHVEDYMAALSDADEAVKLMPDWPRGYQRRGAVLLKLKRARAALEAYTRANELKPGEKDTVNGLEGAKAALEQAQRALGPIYDEMAQGKEHVVQVLNADERTKALAEDDELITRVLHIAEEPALFTPADLVDSRFAAIFSVLYGPINDFKRASPHPEAAAAADSGEDEKEIHEAGDKSKTVEENEEMLLKEADVNIQRGTLWEAADLLERAAKLAPRSWKVYEQLLTVYEKIGDWRLVDRWCRRCLLCCCSGSADDKRSFINDVLARASSHLKRDEAAVRNADDSALMYAAQMHMEGTGDARLAERYAELGKRLFVAKRYSDAAECFRAGAEEAPSSKDKARQFGHCAAALMKLGRYEDAAVECAKSCKENPDDVRGWVRQGWCLQQCNGKTQQARDAYMKGLQVKPDDPDCLAGLKALDTAHQ